MSYDHNKIEDVGTWGDQLELAHRQLFCCSRCPNMRFCLLTTIYFSHPAKHHVMQFPLKYFWRPN